MSDLERAQEWLGCSEAQFYPWTYASIPSADKARPTCGKHHAHQGVWPCPEAVRLAALLAEVRAEEATNIADALSRCGGMSIKTAGALIRDRASRHLRASKP